jgi:3-hydroxyisobutyrate dehydrogenase-like beta-hydroxyacid dehydrogenase
MSTRPPVGFVGLGIMGLAMARNAAAAGYPVRVWNRGEPGRVRAREAGLDVAATPRDLAAASEAVVVLVTDPAAVEAVLGGPQGVLAAPVRGRTLVQMSTIDEPSTLRFADRARAAGMAYLDAPVAGSKPLAEKGQVIVLAGGTAADLDRWRPLLLAMGKAIVHAGPVGKGTALKLAMNVLVAHMTTGLCEATALAAATGVPVARVFEVLDASPALHCGYYDAKKPALLRGDFAPQFSLDNIAKDVRFALAAAEGAGRRLPVTAAVRALLEAGVAAGHGTEDLTSIARVI